MRVVHEAQHGAGVGHLREQGQAGRVDEEALAARAVLQTEGGPQRRRLWRGEVVQHRQHRAEELVQGCEGQLGLRLDRARREDSHVGSQLARLFEQRGLADARVSPQHEGAAARGSRRVE